MKTGECVNLTEDAMAEMAMDELLELTLTTNHWDRDKDHKWQLMGRSFQSKFFVKQNVSDWPIIMEASRSTKVIQMDASEIVYTMMNPEKWASSFAGIVAGVCSKKKLCGGDLVTGDGTMWKIQALLHFMSPFIPSRKVTFIRSCKKVKEDLIAIVDIGVIADGDNARRLPSGLLVRKLGIGKSQVIWVERTEFNVNTISDSKLNSFVIGETGYTSYRSLAMLQQQSKGINPGKVALSSSSSGQVAPPNILKLAKRMFKGFFQVVSDTPGTGWNVLLAEDTQRVMTHDLANPTDMVASLTTSFICSLNPECVFQRFQELFMENCLLSDGATPLQVMDEFLNGISLLRDSVSPGITLTQSSVFDDDTRVLLYTKSFSDFSHADTIELTTSGVVIQNDGHGGSFVTVCIQNLSDTFKDESSNESFLEIAKGHMNRIVGLLTSAPAAGYFSIDYPLRQG